MNKSQFRQNKQFSYQKEPVALLKQKNFNNKFNSAVYLFNEAINKTQSILKHIYLNRSFQQLRKFITTSRNRELLYAAVYKNTNNLRKFKEEKKSQVMLNRQRQEEFQLDEGVSSIHKKSDCSEKDSRIDFQNLFDKHIDPIKKDYLNLKLLQQNQYKRSKTDFSIENNSPYFVIKNRKKSSNSGFMSKKNKKMKKSIKIAQHIFVVRNCERQRQIKSEVKYLEIPVECMNIKIIEMNHCSDKERDQMLSSLNKTNKSNIMNITNKQNRNQRCIKEHQSMDQKCKYCKMTERINQIMIKYSQSTDLFQKIHFH